VLLLICRGCGSTTTVDCTCPPELADLPLHMSECPMNDLDAQLQCPPTAAKCCQEDHGGLSHGAWANQCPGQHAGQPCPTPETCPVWGPMVEAVANLDPANPFHHQAVTQLEAQYGQPVTGPCPGGHCAQGVKGCQVCRPITVQLLRGSTAIRPAPGRTVG
jgi:hypothetical protein